MSYTLSTMLNILCLPEIRSFSFVILGTFDSVCLLVVVVSSAALLALLLVASLLSLVFIVPSSSVLLHGKLVPLQPRYAGPPHVSQFLLLVTTVAVNAA